jgi:hypothetical protein
LWQRDGLGCEIAAIDLETAKGLPSRVRGISDRRRGVVWIYHRRLNCDQYPNDDTENNYERSRVEKTLRRIAKTKNGMP